MSLHEGSIIAKLIDQRYHHQQDVSSGFEPPVMPLFPIFPMELRDKDSRLNGQQYFKFPIRS